MLQQGGSAVDAMVAVNAALGVVYPHMTGPGGDAFWLIHDAATRQQHVLNASGRAGMGATLERYPGPAIEPRGPLAALTVPGAVDGWVEAHGRFGRLPWARCLEPAVEYAREGVPVSQSLEIFSAQCADVLAAMPTTASIYLHADGAPYRRGQVLRNPDLARTLEAIAQDGRAAFYNGPIAESIGAFLAAVGGVLTVEDFSAHRSDWVDPLRVRYRGRTVVAPPPNSQAFAALQILGLLDHHDVASLADDPVGYVDLLVRATALAFQDRDQYLTDPDYMERPAADLVDPQYLAQRATRLARGQPAAALTSPADGGDTTFSCAVDADGNAAAVIQSLYHEWGSGVVAGETGILLQNRGCFFSLDPAHPNSLAPGKRTAHTLSAAMLLDGDRPELVFGTMGGEGQPQTQAVVATRVVDFGHNVQEAIDAPRWLLGRTWGDTHRGLRLEARFGPGTAEALTALGHEHVSLVDDFDPIMGHAQAIALQAEHLEAAADPRSDGAALGY